MDENYLWLAGDRIPILIASQPKQSVQKIGAKEPA